MTVGDLANCCIVGGHRPPLQWPFSTFCAKPFASMALSGPIDKFNRFDRQLSGRYTKGTKHNAKTTFLVLFSFVTPSRHSLFRPELPITKAKRSAGCFALKPGV